MFAVRRRDAEPEMNTKALLPPVVIQPLVAFTFIQMLQFQLLPCLVHIFFIFRQLDSPRRDLKLQKRLYNAN